MRTIYATNRLRHVSRARIGDSAYELARITPPFSMLPGVCLTVQAYTSHLSRAGVVSDIEAVNVADVGAIQRLSARVTEAIFACPPEPDIAVALHSRGRSWRSCLVRSSGLDPVASVQFADAIDPLKAVQAGWASVWHPSRLRDRLVAGANVIPPPIALLVQTVPPARFSGWARPAAMSERWSVTGTPGWPSTREHPVAIPDAVERRIQARLARLRRVGEIQWLVSRDRVYAVTALPAGTGEFTGIGASPGTASGRVRIVCSLRDGQKIGRDSVLVSRRLDPSLTAYIPKIAALVLESGGRTSHVAIVARQFGVPAVLGVRGVTDRLHQDQYVTVDGTLGRVFA